MVSLSYGHLEILSYVASSSFGVLKQVELEYPIDDWIKKSNKWKSYLLLRSGCDQTSFRNLKNLQYVKLMAERVGFEPTIPLTVYKLSKSAARTWRLAQLYFLN